MKWDISWDFMHAGTLKLRVEYMSIDIIVVGTIDTII